KTDPDLRAAHAACPWLFTWDDHEVQNDYANDRSEHLDTPEWFLERRAAAYRAYYEHMPLRRHMVPFGPHMRLFSRVAFGRLAQFHMLDDRQYRSHQPCAPPGRGGASVVEDCEARLDRRLTMLGDVQERWLAAGLDQSNARWNLIGQQTLMAQLDRKPGPGQRFWTDGWDGYPAARRRADGDHAAAAPRRPAHGAQRHPARRRGGYAGDLRGRRWAARRSPRLSPDGRGEAIGVLCEPEPCESSPFTPAR